MSRWGGRVTEGGGFFFLNAPCKLKRRHLCSFSMASCKSEIQTFAYLSKGTSAPHTKMYTTSETFPLTSFQALAQGVKSFVLTQWCQKFCKFFLRPLLPLARCVLLLWIVTRIYKAVSLVSNASEGHLLTRFFTFECFF